ncbi:hypothetical protein E7Z53_07985 [Kocuria salina]|uniref:hypothetical protein n=1 Tax=Kocuria salina TaxID=1929416 RepID=UPI001593187B|nr:hypothetical protein [Kocuria salina]NVC23382.1 hypothetical protein [Kocuria salina]
MTAPDPTAVERAARMPWTVAEEESLWVASGFYPDGGQFQECLARVIPQRITGPQTTPLFQILMWGGSGTGISDVVPASAIVRARELILVEALNPFKAYYEDDQRLIDHALQGRDEA